MWGWVGGGVGQLGGHGVGIVSKMVFYFPAVGPRIDVIQRKAVIISVRPTVIL